MEIGNRIKQLRQKLLLTQEDLSNRCNLSPGFISQVERDLASPSIATLEDILMALGETLESFFKPQNEKVIIASSEDVYTKTFDEGYQIDWIVPNAQTLMMEPIFVTIIAGGQTRLETPHEGEEFGFVLKGDIALILNDEEYPIKPKQSFYFTPDQDHYLKNIGHKDAAVLWVSTPPNF